MAVNGGTIGSWTIGGPEEADDGAVTVAFVDGPTIAVLAPSIVGVTLAPSITRVAFAGSITSLTLAPSVTRITLL